MSSQSAMGKIDARCRFYKRTTQETVCRILNKNKSVRKCLYCTNPGNIEHTMMFQHNDKGGLVVIPNNLEVVFKAEKQVFASRVYYFTPPDCEYPTCCMYEVVPIGPDGREKKDYRRTHHETQTKALKEALDKARPQVPGKPQRKSQRPNGRIYFGVYDSSIQNHLRLEFAQRPLPKDPEVAKLVLQWLALGGMPYIGYRKPELVKLSAPKVVDSKVCIKSEDESDKDELSSSPTKRKNSAWNTGDGRRPSPEESKYWFREIIEDVIHNVDRNEDGYLEPEEILEYLVERLQTPRPVARELALETFQAYTVPGEDKISREDLVFFMKRRSIEVQRMFQMLDANNDGVITHGELIDAATYGHLPIDSMQDIDNLLLFLDHEEVDSNISKKEFFQAMLLLPPNCTLSRMVEVLRRPNSSSRSGALPNNEFANIEVVMNDFAFEFGEGPPGVAPATVVPSYEEC